MKTQAAPTVSKLDGSPYITAVARGTQYTLMRLGDAWFVSSRRLALGRSNAGGGKHYTTLADVAKGCKAFGDLADLMKLAYDLDVAHAINA